MLNLYLLFVNVTSFLIRLLVDFSFGSENGGCRIISFCSSDNHSEITKSCLSLLKYSAVFLIKFLGTPADKNAFVMLFTSKLNLLAILLLLFFNRSGKLNVSATENSFLVKGQR